MKVTVLWTGQVRTDRTVRNYKPDSIIRGDENGTCVITDVAVSGDSSVIKTEVEKWDRRDNRCCSVRR